MPNPSAPLPSFMLCVDLETRSITRSVLPSSYRSSYLGGRGLAARLLADAHIWEIAPCSPEAPFIVAPGLLSASPWPSSSRVHFGFRSPLTEIYGYANAGGALAHRLASQGIAALAIAGRAHDPVYLRVEDGTAVLCDASFVWGMDSDVAEARLLDQVRPASASVACIGPAGERGVPMAGILIDGGRAAARCGGGAVLGHKRLKAIVTVSGDTLRWPRRFVSLASAAHRAVADNPGVSSLAQWGTPYLVAIKNVVGDLPTKNHRLGQVPFVDRVDAGAFEPFRSQTKGCQGCSIRCGRISEVGTGPHQCRSAGPEYESIDALGPNCFCSDAEAIVHANARCNQLGLDTISVGGAISFAMECHERGLLDDPTVDLTWGNPAAILELIEQIASQRGLGALLGQGTRCAAERIGGDALDLAMHVKGLEIPCQEPRVAKAFGLGHATSNRGADHLYGLPTIELTNNETVVKKILPDLLPSVLDPWDETSKPSLLKFSEEYCAVSDALGVCKFTTTETYAILPTDIALALSSLGLPMSASDLLTVGERIVNLERWINVQHGLRSADDTLPRRFVEDSLPLHQSEQVLRERSVSAPQPRIHDLPAMLQTYYGLRGWTRDGLPTETTLARLDLPGQGEDG